MKHVMANIYNKNQWNYIDYTYNVCIFSKNDSNVVNGFPWTQIYKFILKQRNVQCICKYLAGIINTNIFAT